MGDSKDVEKLKTQQQQQQQDVYYVQNLVWMNNYC